MIVDLCSRADHAAKQEDIERRNFQVLLAQRTGSIVTPQDGQKQRGDDGVHIHAKDVW